jgi:hypothetical protein
MEENSEKIWTIWKKRVKRREKYGRNPNWIVIRFGKYKRK